MGPFELGVIAFLGLLLFGINRLPKVGRGLGEATQAWRKGREESEQ